MKGPENWSGKGEQENQQQNSNQNQSGSQATGLGALFGMTSLTAGGRDVIELTEVVDIMNKQFEGFKTSTTNQMQLDIIPTIEKLTSQVSPNLPGVSLTAKIGITRYVMVALFSNDSLNIVSKNIPMFNGGQQNNMFGSMVSTQLAPALYANKEVADNIKAFYTQRGDTDAVVLINMKVVDLEMYKHPEILDDKDRMRHIALDLSQEWEESILVRASIESAGKGGKVPSPFQNPKKPYGQHDAAEARVNAVSGRLNTAGHISPANMEVVISTTNPNSYSDYNQTTSKEIARVTANVSLAAVTYEEFMQTNQNVQMNNMMFSMEGYSGYKPLRPIITIDQTKAGELMGQNGGLFPYFYGLFAVMASNNNYVFAEPLRRVSSTGSLADLEQRLDQMVVGSPMTANALATRVKLTEKTMSDPDVVNQWIKMNVSKHATFQTNIYPAGVNSSINNFLTKLVGKGGQTPGSEELATMVGILDALSGDKFSSLIGRNRDSGKGWIPGKPVLHRTNTIVANGLTSHADKHVNTASFDEMFLANVKGKNTQAIANYLGTVYGRVDSKETYDSRCHRIGVQMKESMFTGKTHINCFGYSCIWDPELMSLIGEALSSIGALNVSGSYGSFQPDAQIFAPGIGLATTMSIGSNGNTGLGFGMEGMSPSNYY